MLQTPVTSLAVNNISMSGNAPNTIDCSTTSIEIKFTVDIGTGAKVEHVVQAFVVLRRSRWPKAGRCLTDHRT